MTHETDFDVIVVGYGPTGELLSILLGQLGYRVGVFERWDSIYNRPRAVHFDDEVGRIFQAAGVKDEILAITDPVPDFYEWRNRHGEALLKIDWARPGAQAWPTANFFTQPELQAVLDRRVAQIPSITVHTGLEVYGFEDRGDTIVAQTHVREGSGNDRESGTEREVTARYLIGADGANSTVRELIGSQFHDLGFVPFDWLILDVIPHDQERVLDPDELAAVRSVTADHCRVGWPGPPALGGDAPSGRTDRDAEHRGDCLEAAGAVGHHAGDGDVGASCGLSVHGPLCRAMATGACLTRRRRGASDAAVRGRRDVQRLARRDEPRLETRSDLVWKSPDDLLESYQAERLDHVRQWIDFSAALGEVICVLDETAASERDARMLAGEADPMRVLPAAPPQRLGDGLFLQQPQAGTHFIQAPVEHQGEAGLFDEILGVGFVLIALNQVALEFVTAADRERFSDIRGRIFYLDDDPGQEAIGDPTGAYRGWLEQSGTIAVLVRPDFYVYGVAGEASAVQTLIESLSNDLQIPAEASRMS